LQQAVTAAAAEVAAAAGVVAARVAVARLRLAVARLMAALAMAARVAAAEPVGAAAALALAFGLEAAGAAPEETTPTAGNGIQPRASGSPSAINGKSGRFRGWPRKFAQRYDEVRPELQPYRCSSSVTPRWPNLYVRLFYNVKLAFQFARDRNLAVEKPFGQWII
jgi:hypothetical protein